jgi:antitoxin MazE
MTIRLSRWGNSTGLRLPAAIMEATGLKAGDYVFVRLLDSGDIRVRPTKSSIPAGIDKGGATPAKPPADDPW